MRPTLSSRLLPAGELPGLPRITQAYLDRFSTVADFFSFSPQASELERAVEAARANPQPRGPLVEGIHAYLRHLHAPAESLAGLEKLRDPQTVVVATGQQPGFGLPLLSLYKAITAVRMAQEIESRGLGPAVPLFWCHSADHDIVEVNRLGIVNQEGETRRIRADLRHPNRTPIEQVTVGDEIDTLWRQTLAELPHSDFRGLVEKLASPIQGESVGNWFSRMLLGTVGHRGLVVLEPHLLRPFYGPLLERAVNHARELGAGMSATTEELQALGFEAPLDPELTPFFFRLSGREGGGVSRDRVRIDLESQEVSFAGEPARVELPDFLESVRAHPEDYSPSAALRPVFQSALFPVAVAVLGPGEIAYHAQLKSCFARFDRSIPLLLPRMSATLVDAKNARFLEELGVEEGQIPRLTEILGTRGGESDARELLPDPLKQTQTRLEADLRGFASSLADLEPSLVKPGSKVVDRTLRDLEKLVIRFVEARSRREETNLRRRRRLLVYLAPEGELQERWLSSLQFLNSHGSRLLDALLTEAETDPFSFHHQILRLPRGGFGVAEEPPDKGIPSTPTPDGELNGR